MDGGLHIVRVRGELALEAQGRSRWDGAIAGSALPEQAFLIHAEHFDPSPVYLRLKDKSGAEDGAGQRARLGEGGQRGQNRAPTS